jgi:DNA invertase Pin-like site-specific DNA recombinase
MQRRIRAFLYCRVSTTDQNAAMQEAELRAYAARRGWEVVKVYKDVISGTREVRPGLDELMAECRKGKADAVLVWKFDRFARGLRHLVTGLDTFRKLGINFISATEGIDTSTPGGELVFGIIGAIAQFERGLMSERVKAGLQQATRNGKKLGRRPIRTLSPAEITRVRADRASGKFSLRQLAAKYGTSLWTMQQVAGARGHRL